MGAVSLSEIHVTPLKRISTSGGDVMHALKRTDPQYMGFGEAYFSWVEAGVVKAWKCHQQTSLNLVVPLGNVRFVFHQEGNIALLSIMNTANPANLNRTLPI